MDATFPTKSDVEASRIPPWSRHLSPGVPAGRGDRSAYTHPTELFNGSRVERIGAWHLRPSRQGSPQGGVEDLGPGLTAGENLDGGFEGSALRLRTSQPEK